MTGRVDLRVKIAGIEFRNPVWVASGTFGYGREFTDFLDIAEAGALVTKTVTLTPRRGNLPPRTVETPSGLLNSIGLENPGADAFIEREKDFLKGIGTALIISVAGDSADELAECAEKICGGLAPDALELNLSCPNVSHGGTARGLVAQDAVATETFIRTVKKRVKVPVIAKLTPNVTDIAEIARAAGSGGADAIAAVNTFFGLAVDAVRKKAVLGNGTGGLSGPAIKPMALKAVKDIYDATGDPVVGIGGITSGRDVAEFLLCGAGAVQVGTANLVDPDAVTVILREFNAYLEETGTREASGLTGKLSG